MRKTLLFMVVLAGMVLASCDDPFFNQVLNKITGTATVTIGEGPEQQFTASLAVIEDDLQPQYAVGLSSVMTIEQALEVDGEEDLIFPFMFYRLVGDSIATGVTFTVDNTLTNEDLQNFDYHTLLTGEYGDSQVLGVAASPDLFYVMKTGTISISQVTNKKLIGTFTGTAYVIDLTVDPILTGDLVPVSGSFSSGLTDILMWLLEMQEMDDTEGEVEA